MHCDDRVYGSSSIDDPRIIDLIQTPTFQRLKRIRQAGPSALAFNFKTVTRYEHSLGVYLLLRRLGASDLECVAGLLHDISHTAFSHASDFLYVSEEQAYHEGLKSEFLVRPDILPALEALGYRAEWFEDDSRFTILERPIPHLCADRLDYFLRDGLTCGVVAPAQAQFILEHVVVHAGVMVMDAVEPAELAAELYARMNRDWWAGAGEAFIYNEFAHALREAMEAGVIDRDDLLSDDESVLGKLVRAGIASIDRRLESIMGFTPAMAEGYVPATVPKQRRLDPDVLCEGRVARLSQLRRKPAKA